MDSPSVKLSILAVFNKDGIVGGKKGDQRKGEFWKN
jgi:hypothetical protein